MNIATAVPQALGPAARRGRRSSLDGLVRACLRARRRVRRSSAPSPSRAVQERALMALDLRLDVAMPDAASDAAPWLRSRAATGRALDRGHRGTSTPPSARCTSTRCRHNAHDMLAARRARRSASRSKSVRVRGVLDAVLALPGYHGVLAYTLAEALWLAEHGRRRRRRLSRPPTAARIRAARQRRPSSPRRVTLMVDSLAPARPHRRRARRPAEREEIRVCLELDASWTLPVLGHLGVRRSPVHDPDDAGALAAVRSSRRPGFRLVGMMALRGADRRRRQPAGRQARRRRRERAGCSSARCAELVERRARAVAAVREHRRPRVRQRRRHGLARDHRTRTPRSPRSPRARACSAPHLFDGYEHFTPAPAAAFALAVVRTPEPRHRDAPRRRLDRLRAARAPTGCRSIVWPEGLKMLPREMAGEVQTPVTGRCRARPARRRPGLAAAHQGRASCREHLNEFAVVDGDAVVDTVPTYRGEGKAFL